MVDLNSTLGTVVRKKVDCVVLATPTDLRRRDGLKEQGRCGHLKKKCSQMGLKTYEIFH